MCHCLNILNLSAAYQCTVVPLYTATLTSGHPSHEATIVWNKPFINVFNLPLTSGHPSYTATMFIPQGWPHKRGTTVLEYDILMPAYGQTFCRKSNICPMTFKRVYIVTTVPLSVCYGGDKPLGPCEHSNFVPSG